MEREFDGTALQAQINRLSGPPRVTALQSAIEQADAAGAHYYRLFFRYLYASEVTFRDDPPKAIPVAMEFGPIFEEHPDVLGDIGPEAYLMITQMAIDPMVSLPQIPLSQWEALMEQFHALVQRFNIGYRVYWWQRCQFYRYVDKEKALIYFQKFWSTPRDDLSDCQACEYCNGIQMYLSIDDVQAAEEIAMPLKQGQVSFCTETPQKMCLPYLEYALNRGDLNAALPYAKQLWNIGYQDKGDLSYMGAVMRCYAYRDLDIAAKLLEAGLPWTIGLWDQKKLYDFYKGAWTVLHQLKKNTDTIKLELPKQFRLYQEDGSYSIEELESWIYAQTADIARRFDRRNGNHYFAEDFSLSQKEPLNC